MTSEVMKQLLLAHSGNSLLFLYLFILMSTSYGFPFSSDLLLILGGSLASMGYLPIEYLAVLAPIAILTGYSITFNLGKKLGTKILGKNWIQSVFPEKKQNKIRTILQSNAKKFIFGIRFFPGMRSFIFLTAGSMQIDSKIFYKMNSLSTLLYAPTLVFVSFYATNRALEIVSNLQGVWKWVACAVVIIVLSVLLKRFGQNKLQAMEENQEK